MKYLIATAGLVLLSGCCSDALADEFGARFGNSSPYALNNTLGNATNNVSGMGPEDLNIIAPAAGAETDPEAEADAEISQGAMEGMGAHAGPDTPPRAPAHVPLADDISP